MADEKKLCVVVNFDEVRFMVSVPSNTTIQELRAEIESIADNNYPQLRSKEIQLLQNSIKANLPNCFTIHEILQGNNEVFAFSSDYSTNIFRRPDSPSRCTPNPCRKCKEFLSEEQHKIIVHDSGSRKEDGHTRSSKLKKCIKENKGTKWRKEMFVLGKSEEKLSDKGANPGNTLRTDDQKSQVEDSQSEVDNVEASESDVVPWPNSDSNSSSSSFSFSDYNGRVVQREARKDTKKNRKTKNEKKVEHTVKLPEECSNNKGVDTVIKHSIEKGERSRKGATNATSDNDILPTPPISPAVTKKALISVTGYKDILKTVENNRPMRKRAIKRSVNKVASWLAMHGEHMSKESEMSEGLKGTEEESEGNNDTTDGQNTRDKEPCINTEQLEGMGRKHEGDSEESEDEGGGGACNLRHDHEEEGDTDVLSEKNDPHAKLIPTKTVSPATNLMKVSKLPFFPVVEICGNNVIYFDELPDGEDESGGMLVEAAVKLPRIVLPRVSRETLFQTAMEVPPVVQPRLDSPPILRETEGSPCGSSVSNEIMEVRTIATQTYPEDFVKESVMRNEEMQKICQDPKSRRNQEVSSSQQEDSNPNDNWTVVKKVQQNMVDGHVIAPGERKADVHLQAFSTKSREDKVDNQTAINEMQRGVTHGHIIAAVSRQNIMQDQTIRDRQIHRASHDSESSDTFGDVEISSHPLFDSPQASSNEEDEATGLSSKGGKENERLEQNGAGVDTATEVVNPQAKHTETKKKKRTLLEVVEQLNSTKEGEKLSGGQKVPNKEINSRGMETPPATEGAESEANIESNRNTKWKTVVCEADRDENQTEFGELNAINSHQQSKRQENDVFELRTGAETNENVGDDTECDANERHKASGGTETKKKRKRKRVGQLKVEMLEGNQSTELEAGEMLENLEGNTECQSNEKCKNRGGNERKQKQKKKKASAKSSDEMEQLGEEKEDNNDAEARVSTDLGTGELIENVREDTVENEKRKRKRKRERVSAELKAEVNQENRIVKAKQSTELDTGETLENLGDDTENKTSDRKGRKRKRKKEKVNTELSAKVNVEQENNFVEGKLSTELETGESIENVRDDIVLNEGFKASREKERKRKRKCKRVRTKLLEKEGELEVEKDNGLIEVQQSIELETGETLGNLEDNTECLANEIHNTSSWKERKREQKSKTVKTKLLDKEREVERDNSVVEAKQSTELETGETLQHLRDNAEFKAKEKHEEKKSEGKERMRQKKSDVVSRELKVKAFEKEENVEQDHSVMEGKQSKKLESKETFENVGDSTECHAHERHKTRGGKERKWERKKRKVNTELSVAGSLEKIGEVGQENNIVETLCERVVLGSEVVEKKSQERTIKRKRVYSYSSGEDFVMGKKDKMAEDTVKKALFDEFDASAENPPVDVKKKKKKEEKKKEREKEKENEKEKKNKVDRTNKVSNLGKIEELAANVEKEDHFVKPSDVFRSQKTTVCVEEKMFINSSSESEPGISFDQVVARALKASPTKKSSLKTGKKGKGSGSFLDLVEDDPTNRPTERRKSFPSSNITSSLTPNYVRPFNSPPQGFTNILNRTKQYKKSQQRTTPVPLVTRRITSASVGHKPRELTSREKELFRSGSKGLAALLDDDTIWES